MLEILIELMSHRLVAAKNVDTSNDVIVSNKHPITNLHNLDWQLQLVSVTLEEVPKAAVIISFRLFELVAEFVANRNVMHQWRILELMMDLGEMVLNLEEDAKKGRTEIGSKN